MKKRGYFKIQEICLKIFLEQWFLREVCLPLLVLYIGTVTYEITFLNLPQGSLGGFP